MTNENKGKLTGWHVLAWLLGFFGVVFAVNGYFIYMALKTYSGEKQHAYLEGLHFNETLEARAEQKQAGWNMELGFKRGAAGDALFTATMTDKQGNPITGISMNGKIGRSTEDKDDQILTFKEASKGVYEAHLDRLGPGKWEFSANANKHGLPPFSTETSLSIR